MSVIRVVSHDSTAFEDRIEAGRLLGRELHALRGQDTVVLGIPRGGMVVANEVARELGAELDVVLVRKLGAPMNPELAIGAIAEDGQVFLDDSLVSRLRVPGSYVQREKERELAQINRRRERYRPVRPKVPLTGRIVIITDDGLATGATMRAALRATRAERPSRLIAAVPVGAEQSIRAVALEADEVVCLRMPPFFGAVGEFYLQFGQTDDEEVLAILRQESQRAASGE